MCSLITQLQSKKRICRPQTKQSRKKYSAIKAKHHHRHKKHCTQCYPGRKYYIGNSR